MNISIGDISSEITKAMQQYTEDVTEAIESELNERSKQLVKSVKAKAPVKTGDYRKGWTRKKNTIYGSVSYTIYNKTKPSLVHLLEKGHAKRGGGRVAGKPHVRPATEREIALLEQNVRSIIQNGG